LSERRESNPLSLRPERSVMPVHYSPALVWRAGRTMRDADSLHPESFLILLFFVLEYNRKLS
jgi:hypothetical protein